MAARQSVVRATAVAFDQYQASRGRLSLSEMTSDYLSTEFPDEIADYIDDIIRNGNNEARASLIKKVNDIFQVIRSKFGREQLDVLFQNQQECSFQEFEDNCKANAKREVNRLRDMGIRGNDISDFNIGPVYLHSPENGHLYVVPYKQDVRAV